MNAPPDSSPFLRHAAQWTAVLSTALAILSLLVSGMPMALGVALGALLGLGNLWLLSRAVADMVDRAHEHRPRGSRKWALPGVLLLKWPIVLLALAGILWYLPARPEGVALGVAVSLLAAALAASKKRGSTSGPPKGPV